MPGSFVANPSPQVSPIPDVPAGSQLDYRIVIASADGTRHGELANFTLARVTWELNTFGTAEFSLPVLDETASLVKVPEREAQIWRGNNMLWAGPMVRASANGQTLTVQCQGLGWYYKRRHFGKANRINFLANPQFEESAIGTFPVKWAQGGVTASVIESYRILGSRSVELYNTVAGVDTHIHQQVYFNTDSNGVFFTLVGHFFIRNTDWVGPATLNRGLYIEVRNDQNVVTHHEQVDIDQNTPRESWQRAEVGIHLPPNVTGWSVDVRCYAVGGRIVWDATSLTVMESTSTAVPQEDQAIFAARMSNHAQDPVYGKSALGINPDTPLTGVKIWRTHQHTDHLSVLDGINERVGVRDGYEWDIRPHDRAFTTYFPRKTNERSDLVFGLGPDYGEYFTDGIVEFSVEVDGEATANSVTVLGEGEGPDREEGGATDAGTLGGLTLERVIFAPTGSPIAILDALAYAALERLKRPVTVPSITIRSPALIGSLNTGDVIRVVINHGWVQLNGRYRIVRVELDARQEQMTLALNPAELYETP